MLTEISFCYQFTEKVESVFIKQKSNAGSKKTVGRGNVNAGSDGSSIGLVERKTKKKSMAEMMMEEAKVANNTNVEPNPETPCESGPDGLRDID